MKKDIKYTESGGGVVVNNDGLIIVVNQRGTSWSLPKGHIENGESAIEAAEREIYEESGIKNLKLIKSLGRYQRYRIDPAGGEDRTELKTIFMFLFKTKETNLRVVDPHNPESKWVKKEDVAQLLSHPKDKEFFLSIINEINS